MKVKCVIVIFKYPFDAQSCELSFGSWSYTINYLNYTLMLKEPDLSNYTENNEWILVSFSANRVEVKYANWVENDSFSEIRYKVLLKRKPLFVVTNCIIPALMLSMLSLSSFFIPFAQVNIVNNFFNFSIYKKHHQSDLYDFEMFKQNIYKLIYRKCKLEFQLC